jgi:Fe-coproporphyrin III synthase
MFPTTTSSRRRGCEVNPGADLALIEGSGRLPLVTLYLTERCNSRCVSCDYWRHGRDDASLAAIERMLGDLGALGTRTVLVSGGEPLLHREWQAIARTLRERGIALWLLTAGLALAKHARAAAELFESITVSLDGTCAETYAAIRGLDAFDKVCEGIRLAASAGAAVSLRVTLQRANYRELPRFVALARELGARQISFLAVDVGNAHAFARSGESSSDLALRPEDLPVFEDAIAGLERDHAADFERRFIAESPLKLRRMLAYFGALHGRNAFPRVACNAPEFSAVVGVDGRVSPCFFIPGPDATRGAGGLRAALEGEESRALRADIRAGRRRECERCVCSLWREPARGARHA